jgi:hypothetical protein
MPFSLMLMFYFFSGGSERPKYAFLLSCFLLLEPFHQAQDYENG